MAGRVMTSAFTTPTSPEMENYVDNGDVTLRLRHGYADELFRCFILRLSNEISRN